MDTALQALLSYQFLLFCLAISAFTYVVTIVVNYCFHAKGYIAKESHFWSELILPILPVVLGSFGALIAKQYPYPAEITSASGRFAFGLVAGLLSGFAWRWVKAIISSKLIALATNPVQPPVPNDNSASAGKVEDTENKG
jgi:hypothetical protein